jgi:hypothetical protein
VKKPQFVFFPPTVHFDKKTAAMAQSELNERKWVLLLCLCAAIHVFVFPAAFPFFNNVDEEAHFDLAVKYSHGHVPRALEPLSDESLDYSIFYSSLEYLWPPPPGQPFPPPMWIWPADKAAPVLAARKALWNDLNHEASQPPLYYTMAGLWWHAGKLCGFHGGFLLYWLRFLNLVLVAVLVWLGYVAARLVFPGERFLQLGVPAVLAFFPQTAFYSIQNDVLSPVCFGAAFVLLVHLGRAETPGIRLGAAAGLALAATFLTKFSNLPLLAVAAVFAGLKARRLARAGKLRAAVPALLALGLCAGLPMLGWLAWCKYNFGDFTGTAAKIQFLGWTHKPLGEWGHHPIFTPLGLGTFIFKLMARFWRGEFLWHGQPLASPAVDAVYVISSAGLVILALAGLRPRFAGTTESQRSALWFGFWSFIAAGAFLGFLSIIYDFHNCANPSRAYPCFVSGRLTLGALIPFVMLYVYGLDRALGCVKNNRIGPLLLAGMLLFVLASEIATDWPAFSSQYNWFHM